MGEVIFDRSTQDIGYKAYKMNKLYKGIVISSILIVSFWLWLFGAFGATYYMRSDGTAANLAAAVGPETDASKCMSPATFVPGSITLSPGDMVYVSGLGGIYTGWRWVLGASGTSKNPIQFIGSNGPKITWHNSSFYAFYTNGKSYNTIKNIVFENTNGYDIHGWLINAGDGIYFENCRFDFNRKSPSGNLIVATDIASSSSVEFYRCLLLNSAGADGFLANWTKNTGTLSLKFKSSVFSNYQFAIISDDAIDPLEIINCTFLANSNASIYLADAGHRPKIKNNVFMDYSAAHVSIIFDLATGQDFIKNPTHIDMTHNGFWRNDCTFNDIHRTIVVGTEQELFPPDNTNRWLNPNLDGFAIGAGSYLAGRGNSGDLPAADITGASWRGADIGAYANPPLRTFTPVPGTICFIGDSIMYGANAKPGNTCWEKFGELTNNLTIVNGTTTSIGGMSISGFFWALDNNITANGCETVFTDVGLANIAWTDYPANVTLKELGAHLEDALQKVEDWGATPIWLGFGSKTGNPPDNAKVDDLQSRIEARCVTNGWKYGSWLDRMRLRSDWKDHGIYYFCLDGEGCKADIHPNDNGQLLIGSLAESLY